MTKKTLTKKEFLDLLVEDSENGDMLRTRLGEIAWKIHAESLAESFLHGDNGDDKRVPVGFIKDC